MWGNDRMRVIFYKIINPKGKNNKENKSSKQRRGQEKSLLGTFIIKFRTSKL
jgi:hypothetical protein